MQSINKKKFSAPLFLYFTLCIAIYIFFVDNLNSSEFEGDIQQNEMIPKDECHTLDRIKNDESISDYRDNYVPCEFRGESAAWIYADIFLLCVFLFGGILAARILNSKRMIFYIGILALFYFGVIRGGCICPIGAVSNITVGMIYPGFCGIGTAIIFLLPLLTALIAGRIFCSCACPIGILQDIFPGKSFFFKKSAFTRKFFWLLPASILILTVSSAIMSGVFLICILDPYKPIFFTGHALFSEFIAWISGKLPEHKIVWACGAAAWGLTGIAFAAGFLLSRPFCRLICPYGVILAAVSKLSLFKRYIVSSGCKNCLACLKVCPVQAIYLDEKSQRLNISNSACIQCGKCSTSCKHNAIKFGASAQSREFNISV